MILMLMINGPIIVTLSKKPGQFLTNSLLDNLCEKWYNNNGGVYPFRFSELKHQPKTNGGLTPPQVGIIHLAALQGRHGDQAPHLTTMDHHGGGGIHHGFSPLIVAPMVGSDLVEVSRGGLNDHSVAPHEGTYPPEDAAAADFKGVEGAEGIEQVLHGMASLLLMYLLYHSTPSLSIPFCVKIEGLALDLFHLLAIQHGLDQQIAQQTMGFLGLADVSGVIDDVLHFVTSFLSLFDVYIITHYRQDVKLRSD